MCEVWRKDDLDALLPYQGDLNVPTLVPSKEFGVYYADADELRIWRKKQKDRCNDDL